MSILDRRTSRRERTSLHSGLVLATLIATAIGCSTVGGTRGKQLVPTNHKSRIGPFLVSSDFEMKDDSPVVVCLKTLEREVATGLDLEATTSDPTIEVYILNNRESFSHFLKFYFPDLPPRRAFFIAQGESRVVYTFDGPKLEEDLRHEATHALLNLRFGDLPLWLDEGLAEYFEVVSPADAVSQEHLARLPAGWKPDLYRLESLADIRQMTPEDYREAWAWVYSLLNQPGPGKATLLEYLRESPTTRAEAPLSARLASSGIATDGAALIAYIDSIRNRRLLHNPSPKPRIVRSQDRPLDAFAEYPPPQQRGFMRGLMRRLGSAFGY